MNSRNPDSFSDRMEEASSLPADDALRVEIERAVAGNGSSDAARWNDLLTEAQTIREALADVSVPTELHQRLLAIPETLPVKILTAAKDDKRLVGPLAWIVSAVVVVAVGILMLQPRQNDSRLETVALLAVNNHLNHVDDQHLHVETDDGSVFKSGLAGEIPFEVVVPRLNRKLALLGGRKCTLGAHPAALSLWKSGGDEYSVFQFRRNDLGIPPMPDGRFVQLNDPAAGGAGSAWVWTRGDFGFVLVGASKSPLKQLSPLTIDRRPQ